MLNSNQIGSMIYGLNAWWAAGIDAFLDREEKRILDQLDQTIGSNMMRFKTAKRSRMK
jgi:hypothetical protein